MCCIRGTRTGVTVLSMVFMLLLQGFLVVNMRELVTKKAVHDIRGVYEKFEIVMYGNDTYTNSVGYERGRKGSFDESRFDLLSDDEQDEVCAISLSQPLFFTTILMLWTLTVFADLRK